MRITAIRTQRLATDGLTEDDLIHLLAEQPTAPAARLSYPLDGWLRSSKQVFAHPAPAYPAAPSPHYPAVGFLATSPT